MRNYDYIFDTYIKKELTNNFNNQYLGASEETKREYIILYKEKIREVISEFNLYFKKFNYDNAPIQAKDYERFFNSIIDKRKELQKYSSQTILLDNIPLHPNILYYLLKAKLMVYGIKNNEVCKIFYDEFLNDNQIKKPPYTKNTNKFFVNIFKHLIENSDDEEITKEYLKIWLSFYPESKSILKS